MTVLDDIYTAAGLPIRGLRPALAI
jgi:hypothetical protein